MDELWRECVLHPFRGVARQASVRALCNGKTLAFQARDAGSIPAARSSFLFKCVTFLG